MPGRTPPHDITAEVCVLGSMLVDETKIPAIAEVLSAEDFHRPAHELLFGVLVKMHADGWPVDLATVQAKCKEAGIWESIGDMDYVGDIAEDVPSAKNADYYAKVVADKARKRQIIERCEATAARAWDDNCPTAEVLADAQEWAFSMQAVQDDRRSDAAESATELLASMAAGERFSIPTGMMRFDFATGGLRPGRMYVVAGFTSVGKTALALWMAANIADSGTPALFVSREMPKDELAERLLSGMSGVPLRKIARRELTSSDGMAIEKARDRLANQPLVFDCRSSRVSQIASSARRLASESKQPIGVIVVDYLQLLLGDGRSLREQVVNVSRGLKLLAVELNTSVVALSQLARPMGLKPGDNPKPHLHGMKESGSIEQDADVVLLLWNPSRYSTADRCILHAALPKNRGGVRIDWPDHAERPVQFEWRPSLTWVGDTEGHRF